MAYQPDRHKYAHCSVCPVRGVLNDTNIKRPCITLAPAPTPTASATTAAPVPLPISISISIAISIVIAAESEAPSREGERAVKQRETQAWRDGHNELGGKAAKPERTTF